MLKNKAGLLLICSIVFFSLMSGVVSLYPLLASGPKGVFFNFEPEAAYIANAMLFNNSFRMSYDGHPGTPSIMAISLAITPLYTYSRLIEKVPFLFWSIANERFLYYYAKILQTFFFVTGTGVFLIAIHKLTKSYLAIPFAWFGLFLYTYTPYLGMIVQSEPLSFLILSFWLLVFSKFLEQRKFKYYLALCIISGLSIANKLPNIFFLLASVVQVFSFPKLRLRQRLNYFFKGVIAGLSAFVIGTLPIITHYVGLWKWIVELATHSGIHGSGGNTIFDLASYMTSVNTLLIQEKCPIILMSLTIVIWIIAVRKFRKSLQLPISLFVLFISMGLIVFAKFSLIHYHIFHYYALLFVGSLIVSKFPKILLVFIIGIIALSSIKSVENYWRITFLQIRNTVGLESFIESHPPMIATVWEWGKAEDFVLLFNADVLGNPYAKYLHNTRPGLYNLTTDLNRIILDPRNIKKVFSVCWDQIYIQESASKIFKIKYADQKLNYQLIDNTENMYLITSNHCGKDTTSER